MPAASDLRGASTELCELALPLRAGAWRARTALRSPRVSESVSHVTASGNEEAQIKITTQFPDARLDPRAS